MATHYYNGIERPIEVEEDDYITITQPILVCRALYMIGRYNATDITLAELKNWLHSRDIRFYLGRVQQGDVIHLAPTAHQNQPRSIDFLVNTSKYLIFKEA